MTDDQKMLAMQEFTTLRDAKQATRVPMQYLPILGSLVIDPGATPKALSEANGVEIDGMSRTLKALRVDYGAVDFVPDEKDGRSKHFYLTRVGRDEAVRWLEARGISLSKEQIDSIPVAVPQRVRIK